MLISLLPRIAKRKKIILLLLFFVPITLSPVCAQPDKEKEAIKAVIIRETSSFMNVDRKNWSESWLHTPYAYWSYSDSTSSTFIDGWDAIDKTYDTYFKTQKPSTAKISDEWIEVRVYGTGAYARFIQKSTDNIDIDETSQIRVLEKKDGKWWVVHVGVVAKYAKKQAN